MQSVTNKSFLTNHLILTPVTDDATDFEVEFQCKRTGDEVTMVCKDVDVLQFATMRPSCSTPGSVRIGSVESGALSVTLSDGTLEVVGLDALDLADDLEVYQCPKGWSHV